MSLYEIIQADALKVMEDLGEDATYIPAGTADEYPTRAYMSTAAHRPAGVEIARAGTGRQPQKSAKLMVKLPRLRENEAASPVGDAAGLDGGIKVLGERDVVRVPGRAIGQPGVATVDLIITGGIDSPARSGHWWAEVRE
jgi:hypothetical protein